MFRSQIDHHQRGTIFFLTSVAKFYLILFILFILFYFIDFILLLCRSGYDYPDRHSNNKTRQDPTHTLQQVKKVDNLNSIFDNSYDLIYFLLNLFLLSLAGMLLHQSIK